jgi:hypothetical protein
MGSNFPCYHKEREIAKRETDKEKKGEPLLLR